MASNPPPLEIGQAYALRAWTIWLQSQIAQAQPELQRQIGEHQREIARLRAAVERSTSVLESLRTTIDQLDEILHNVQDTDIMDAAIRSISNTEQRPLVRVISPAQNDSDVPDDARSRN